MRNYYYDSHYRITSENDVNFIDLNLNYDDLNSCYDSNYNIHHDYFHLK